MRHPQVLVYEGDGRLTGLLRPMVEQQAWLLREVRDVEEVRRLARRGGPAVLLIRAGRDLEREVEMLERVTWLCPGTAAVVVAEVDYAQLAALAWDLGAAYVVVPPQSRETVPEIVRRLLDQEGT